MAIFLQDRKGRSGGRGQRGKDYAVAEAVLATMLESMNNGQHYSNLPFRFKEIMSTRTTVTLYNRQQEQLGFVCFNERPSDRDSTKRSMTFSPALEKRTSDMEDAIKDGFVCYKVQRTSGNQTRPVKMKFDRDEYRKIRRQKDEEIRGASPDAENTNSGPDWDNF